MTNTPGNCKTVICNNVKICDSSLSMQVSKWIEKRTLCATCKHVKLSSTPATYPMMSVYMDEKVAHTWNKMRVHIKATCKDNSYDIFGEVDGQRSHAGRSEKRWQFKADEIRTVYK